MIKYKVHLVPDLKDNNIRVPKRSTLYTNIKACEDFRGHGLDCDIVLKAKLLGKPSQQKIFYFGY